MTSTRSFKILSLPDACYFLPIALMLICSILACRSHADDAPSDTQPPVEKVSLFLHDGSVLIGKLNTDSITVDTAYGTLTVPVEKLIGFRPGLSHQPERHAKLQALIKTLSDDNAAKRTQAKQALMAMEPFVEGLVRKSLAKEGADHNKEVTELLAALASRRDDEDVPASEPSLIVEDTIKTADFTIVGRIEDDDFTLTNHWGTLKVPIQDIMHAQRGSGPTLQDVQKSLALTGANLAQLSFKSSRIQVQKGDRIIVSATGNISRSSSSSYRSTPAGASRLGTYMSNPQIYGGTLVAKIDDGKVFKVGAKATITAKNDGTLRFAIGMRPDYVGRYSFLGQYQVKVKVVRSK